MVMGNKKGMWGILILIFVVLIIGLIYAIIKGAWLGGVNVIHQKECPEGIIPDKIAIWRPGITNEYNPDPSYRIANTGVLVVKTTDFKLLESVRKQTWADGTAIGTYGQYESYNFCHVGSSKGESINNLYCETPTYEKSVTNISPEGVIGDTETQRYRVSLILPISSKENTNEPEIFYYNISDAECIIY